MIADWAHVRIARCAFPLPCLLSCLLDRLHASTPCSSILCLQACDGRHLLIATPSCTVSRGGCCSARPPQLRPVTLSCSPAPVCWVQPLALPRLASDYLFGRERSLKGLDHELQGRQILQALLEWVGNDEMAWADGIASELKRGRVRPCHTDRRSN